MKRRVTRSEQVVTREVEVSKLVTPMFLTLTEKPANQVAFKVVRDDSPKDAPMNEQTKTPHKRRVRSTQRSALLFVTFPEGTTDEQIAACAVEYGIEDYALTTDATGRKCLQRSDLTKTPDDALTVTIGEGRIAGVVRSEPAVAAPDAMPHIALVAIEFNKEMFATEELVMDFLKRNDIDFLEEGVENTDNQIRVVRTEVAEGTELRKVEVEPGVIALVSRSEMMDMTMASPFTDVISETAYGQWGWGQLDFGARMADVDFCSAAEDATYTLRRVVEDILFYSQLPLAVRKELVSRAASQFSVYIGSLIDALPAKVVLINRSNLEKLKEQSMKTTTNTAGAADQVAQRTDEPATAQTPAEQVDGPVLRSELKALIGEAVASALAVKPTTTIPDGDGVTRSEEAKPEGEAGADSKLLGAVEQVVTRSVGGMADAVKGLTDRLTALEGATTVRSDGADNAATEGKKDPFVGMFNRS